MGEERRARACGLRRGAAGAAVLASLVAAAPSPGAAGPGEVGLGVDLSFAPLYRGRPLGPMLQPRRHPDSATIRLAENQPSITAVTDLGLGWRRVRLDRFGRKLQQELHRALAPAVGLVLDLRGNRGGSVRRMLAVAAQFTGARPGALRLIRESAVRTIAIPSPAGRRWQGRLVVLVGANTMSSGEVLAALLRRYAGSRVLGERTYGKDAVLRVEPLNPDWRALIPDGRLEVPGEHLAGGLMPDGSIPHDLLRAPD